MDWAAAILVGLILLFWILLIVIDKKNK